MGKILAFILQFVPGVGPLLSAGLGLVTTFAKPTASIADAVEKDAAAAIKTVLGNAALREAILLAALVFLVMHEQGVIKGLKAQLVDPATGIGWQVTAADWRAAFDREQVSFRAVDAALKDQNARVAALGAAGRAKLIASGSLARDTAGALQRDLAGRVAIETAGQGLDACGRALAVDTAFLERLP